MIVKKFKQKQGFDFFNTYSHVTRITSIRVIIAIATLYNLKIHQIGIKLTFLNGKLDKELYIEQPEGFIALDTRKMCVELLIYYMD